MPEDDRIDGAVQLAQDAIQRVAALEDRVDHLEEENERLREENRRLRDRNDLLDQVRAASALEPEKRAVVLLRTLYNRAQANDEAGREPRAKMDCRDARNALGGSAKRWMAYDAMETAAELVRESTGNGRLLTYVKKDRSESENSHLRLDLREGTLPPTIKGHDITGGVVHGD